MKNFNFGNILFVSLVQLILLLGYACHAQAISSTNAIYIDPAFGEAPGLHWRPTYMPKTKR